MAQATQPPPPTVPDWSIGDRIRKAREEADLDQQQLADRTGIARTTISNYERGSTHPSKGYVRLIAMATGIDSTWIWTGTPSAVGDRRRAPRGRGDPRRPTFIG